MSIFDGHNWYLLLVLTLVDFKGVVDVLWSRNK